MGRSGHLEMGRCSCDLGVSLKKAAALLIKKYGGTLKKSPLRVKGCRIVMAAGSLFKVAEGIPLFCLARLEHPRFLGGADEWPPCCYGLTTVIPTAVHVVAKHHKNNRGYKQPTKTDHVKTSCYCLVLILSPHRLQQTI